MVGPAATTKPLPLHLHRLSDLTHRGPGLSNLLQCRLQQRSEVKKEINQRGKEGRQGKEREEKENVSSVL
ncbi:hypothetical protein L484_017372 [Morus notabilis]|uniref:Uncharacterized protein n=1 Tax=Morus notabilis TaxID=981085 RepID=W9R512_9ROSA|nr:hypothetical protein L484_017372 [Morus notabilis]